ncbi:hypothetical protein Scep_024715 [Stephania cephalantha]|uniref:Uncharacterized protein n=1 Tax=Stephania cephalantha TaxID=152367 RepID=A0AAP0EZU6_9MAGN
MGNNFGGLVEVAGATCLQTTIDRAIIKVKGLKTSFFPNAIEFPCWNDLVDLRVTRLVETDGKNGGMAAGTVTPTTMGGRMGKQASLKTHESADKESTDVSGYLALDKIDNGKKSIACIFEVGQSSKQRNTQAHEKARPSKKLNQLSIKECLGKGEKEQEQRHESSSKAMTITSKNTTRDSMAHERGCLSDRVIHGRSVKVTQIINLSSESSDSDFESMEEPLDEDGAEGGFLLERAETELCQPPAPNAHQIEKFEIWEITELYIGLDEEGISLSPFEVEGSKQIEATQAINDSMGETRETSLNTAMPPTSENASQDIQERLEKCGIVIRERDRVLS